MQAVVDIPAEAPASTSTRQVPVRRPVVGALVTAIGALVTIAGAFLPWAALSGLAEGTISGTEDGRDGVITLIAALIVLALAAMMVAARSRVAAVFVALAGLLVTGVAVYDASNLRTTTNPFDAILQINVGGGLWLTLVAGIVIVIGGAIGFARR